MTISTLVSYRVGHRGRSECEREEMEGWSGVECDDGDRESEGEYW